MAPNFTTPKSLSISPCISSFMLITICIYSATLPIFPLSLAAPPLEYKLQEEAAFALFKFRS